MVRHSIRQKQNILLILILLLSAPQLKSQTDSILSLKIESGLTIAHGSHAPLWFTAGRSGLGSISTSSGYLDAGIFYQQQLTPDWKLGGGLELVAAYNFNYSFLVRQAYADINYKWLWLSVGSKIRSSSIVNEQLSSGDLLESENARPIAQVRIGIENYVPVPFTNSWFSLKGYIAYGKFTDDKWQKKFVPVGSSYTRDVLYNSRSLFFKFGKMEQFPLECEIGMNLDAQFGGERWIKGENQAAEIYPHSFKDYIRVLLGLSGGSSANISDQLNVIGNQLGTWNFALTANLHKWKIKGYYQHLFEDGSGMGFNYGPWMDGLIGLELHFPQKGWIDGIVVECIGTKKQTAPVYNEFIEDLDELITGCDNYYNNGLYLGWQQSGMAIGNPLLTSPIYNTNHQIRFENNRISGQHLAIMGHPTPQWSYRALLTYTRNWGTYSRPFDDCLRQFYSLLEVTWKPYRLSGWEASLSAALDRGTLLANSIGSMLTIRKTGIIR